MFARNYEVTEIVNLWEFISMYDYQKKDYWTDHYLLHKFDVSLSFKKLNCTLYGKTKYNRVLKEKFKMYGQALCYLKMSDCRYVPWIFHSGRKLAWAKPRTLFFKCMKDSQRYILTFTVSFLVCFHISTVYVARLIRRHCYRNIC